MLLLFLPGDEEGIGGRPGIPVPARQGQMVGESASLRPNNCDTICIDAGTRKD